jgi:hypothetical protein
MNKQRDVKNIIKYYRKIKQQLFMIWFNYFFYVTFHQRTIWFTLLFHDWNMQKNQIFRVVDDSKHDEKITSYIKLKLSH